MVCADVAFHDSHEWSIDGYELVFTISVDEDMASNQARRAVPDGGIPLVAFDQADLLRIMAEMANRKLKPGESYNWSHDMRGLHRLAYPSLISTFSLDKAETYSRERGGCPRSGRPAPQGESQGGPTLPQRRRKGRGK